jgi:hypothetical protein
MHHSGEKLQTQGGQMNRVSWAALAVMVALLIIVSHGRGDEPPLGGKKKRTPTPHLRVGGRVNHLSRPGKDMLFLDCFTPGNRGGQAIIGVKIGQASMLLRADADGRMTPIGFDDLYKNESASMRAVISRARDSSAHQLRLVYWLVIYPDAKAAPPLHDAAVDTGFRDDAVIPEV